MDRRPFRELIGRWIDDIREVGNISASQMLKPIGMNSNTYSNILSGRTVRRDKYALALLASLREVNKEDYAALGARMSQTLMEWEEEYLKGKKKLPAKEILEFFLK